MARIIAVLAFLGLLWAASAGAETIRFVNGASVRGHVEDHGAHVVIRSADGQVLRVKRSLISTISPDAEAAGKPEKPAEPETAASAPGASAPLSQILDRPMTVDFQQMPLPDVVQYLRAETGLNFVIDPGIKADEITITLSLRDMKLINILRWIAYVGKVAIVIKGDGPVVRLAAKDYRPEGIALYDARPALLSVVDRPAQPFNLAEGTSALSQSGSSGQTGRRTARGRDPQDIDLQSRGHDLVGLLVRTTGAAHWDNAFVLNRLSDREYLAGD
jgi:hypothetical protein